MRALDADPTMGPAIMTTWTEPSRVHAVRRIRLAELDAAAEPL